MVRRGNMDKRIKPQRSRSEDAVRTWVKKHLESAKFVQLFQKCTCSVWEKDLLQSAAATAQIRLQSDQLTAMLCGLLCSVLLFTAPLSQVVCPDCPRPNAYIIRLLAGAPSRSYGNQQQRSDQTATAAFPSVFLVKGALCIAYDFITVFSPYVAQS